VENVFASFNMQDVEPATKLKGDDAGTVHLVTFKGLSADFALTKTNGQTWMTVTATGSGAAAKQAADITARTKGWAYEVPADKASTLTTKLADLVQPPASKPGK
ncbi:MAG TPA: hypothetical protein VMB71_15085, partial [Acetobacteraceae bacterium]|nr:hypothetical protein [Acetobacteraceae bacterium]